MATELDWLQNLAEGLGSWKPSNFTAFVRLQKKGLAEFVPGAPPRWRVTDAGWEQVKDLLDAGSRAK